MLIRRTDARVIHVSGVRSILFIFYFFAFRIIVSSFIRPFGALGLVVSASNTLAAFDCEEESTSASVISGLRNLRVKDLD
jgi:hypothetical protein